MGHGGRPGTPEEWRHANPCDHRHGHSTSTLSRGRVHIPTTLWNAVTDRLHSHVDHEVSIPAGHATVRMNLVQRFCDAPIQQRYVVHATDAEETPGASNVHGGRTAADHSDVGSISCRPMGLEPITFEWSGTGRDGLTFVDPTREAETSFRVISHRASDANGNRADVTVDCDLCTSARSW